MGRGDRVRLWHDRWCGDVTLKESFHVLYDCASNQAATISEVLVRENGRVDWHVTFVRNFNDWELDIIASYLGLLQSHLPSRKVDDGLRWNLKKKGIFDVQSLYTALRESPTIAFPWKSIWRTKAPRMACFFVWTAAWNKILTSENLSNRGYTLTSSVVVMARLLITSYYIVLLQVFSGVGSFRPLGYIGPYLGQLLIYCLAGGMF